MDFLDLAIIIRSGAISWAGFVNEAVKDRIAGPAWFGLSFCAEQGLAPIPKETLKALARPWHAKPAVGLKKALTAFGGPHRVPTAFSEGPLGRAYEAFLEGHPGGIYRLLKPLFLPSRARLQVLSGGSFKDYLRMKSLDLCRQVLGPAKSRTSKSIDNTGYFR